MKRYYLNALSETEIKNLCQRSANDFGAVFSVAKRIIEDVKKNGDKAVRRYTKEFDGVELEELRPTQKEIEKACAAVSLAFKTACAMAAANIEKFHRAQIYKTPLVETTKGVRCWRESRPIEKVGFYIPGGTAPLPSTVLMLGIPAKLAACKETILCTPPQKDGYVPDAILYAAQLCGITKIFKVGGAQAIAAMAYGTQTVPKVDKIFGPGNQYVTAAKLLASIDPEGAAIDFPAGPTELLVVADKTARSDFVASDLLSQAEHGTDSQVVLVCTDAKKTEEILQELQAQVATLPRRAIATAALAKSFALVVKDVAEAISFSNLYAPEHLILNVARPEQYIKKITNAGSVFLGPWSCESAGDYASGTNHVLPTSGYARAYGGISVESFMKWVPFQKLTAEGAANIGPTVTQLADAEGLAGHKRAMAIRLQSLPLKKYAFLDRDGTLIYEPQDTFQIDTVEKLRILDGVIEGLKKLKADGYRLILVTNQDGLGTPSFPYENFQAPHERMLEIFREDGITFEHIFICPHVPEDNCACRKPKTGLVNAFWKKNRGDVDLQTSFMCGDRDTDRQFAENLGIRFIPTKTNESFGQVMEALRLSKL